MLIPVSLILAFTAGAALCAPVTAWITSKFAKLKAFEVKEEAEAKAKIQAVVADLPKA
jgi:hypothetical protein